MSTVRINEPEPLPIPPVTVDITLTEEEAKVLANLLFFHVSYALDQSIGFIGQRLVDYFEYKNVKVKDRVISYRDGRRILPTLEASEA